MSRISLNLSNETIKVISAIAKEHDATISEVSRYLLAKGLANYKNNSAEETTIVPTKSTSSQPQI